MRRSSSLIYREIRAPPVALSLRSPRSGRLDEPNSDLLWAGHRVQLPRGAGRSFGVEEIHARCVDLGTSKCEWSEWSPGGFTESQAEMAPLGDNKQKQQANPEGHALFSTDELQNRSEQQGNKTDPGHDPTNRYLIT